MPEMLVTACKVQSLATVLCNGAALECKHMNILTTETAQTQLLHIAFAHRHRDLINHQ